MTTEQIDAWRDGCAKQAAAYPVALLLSIFDEEAQREHDTVTDAFTKWERSE